MMMMMMKHSKIVIPNKFKHIYPSVLIINNKKEYEGYDIEGLLSVIKELEAVNDILWEYISDKDIDEIYNKMEKLDV